MSKPNSAPAPQKESTTPPKKAKPWATHSTTYNCVCGSKFETVATSAQNFSVTSCSQCNPFYTGSSVQEVRVGAVAKFRQKFENPSKKG